MNLSVFQCCNDLNSCSYSTLSCLLLSLNYNYQNAHVDIVHVNLLVESTTRASATRCHILGSLVWIGVYEGGWHEQT